MPPYSSEQIANEFIKRHQQSHWFGKSIQITRLMQLVWIADFWHIKLSNGKKLIDEDVQARSHGPCIPTLWHRLLRAENGKIDDYMYVGDENKFIEKSDVTTKALLDKIYEVYKNHKQFSSNSTGASAWLKRWKEMKEEGLQKSAIPIQYIIDSIEV